MSSRMRGLCTLQRDSSNIGIDSDEAQAWTTIATFRAEVRPLRFSESEREGAVRAVQGYLLVLHTSTVRAHTITAADRVLWNGRTLNIREVRDPEPGVRFTEIIAESGVTQ